MLWQKPSRCIVAWGGCRPWTAGDGAAHGTSPGAAFAAASGSSPAHAPISAPFPFLVQLHGFLGHLTALQPSPSKEEDASLFWLQMHCAAEASLRFRCHLSIYAAQASHGCSCRIFRPLTWHCASCACVAAWACGRAGPVAANARRKRPGCKCLHHPSWLASPDNKLRSWSMQVVVSAVLPEAAALGIVPGQKLVGISDPVRETEVWSIPPAEVLPLVPACPLPATCFLPGAANPRQA